MDLTIYAGAYVARVTVLEVTNLAGAIRRLDKNREHLAGRAWWHLPSTDEFAESVLIPIDAVTSIVGTPSKA